MPIKSLLKVKLLREETATRELAKAKQTLAEKEAELKSKEKELTEFIIFKKKEKIRLFEELKARNGVIMKEVNINHHHVSDLHLKEMEKIQGINDAKKALELAKEAYEAAKITYFQKYK